MREIYGFDKRNFMAAPNGSGLKIIHGILLQHPETKELLNGTEIYARTLKKGVCKTKRASKTEGVIVGVKVPEHDLERTMSKLSDAAAIVKEALGDHGIPVNVRYDLEIVAGSNNRHMMHLKFDSKEITKRLKLLNKLR